MSERTILVTGATGNQGGAVLRALIGHGFRLRAMTRKPDSAAAQALHVRGVEVLHGDLDDDASLTRALGDAWGVFAVQNTWEAGVEREETQGKRVATLARKAGVHHFVYTSVGSAHRSTGIPHFENKSRVEETVRSLGFPSYVILRPVFFMENLVSPSFLNGDVLAAALAPTTSLQMIAVADIGRFGAAAFTDAARLNGRAIDIAGDSKTMPEAAEILGRALGRSIQFVPVPIGDVRKFSADLAAMLEWFDAVGYDANIPSLVDEFGFTPKSLAAWARSLPRT